MFIRLYPPILLQGKAVTTYHQPVEQGLIIKTRTDDDLTIPINKKGEKTIRLMFQLFKLVASAIVLPNTNLVPRSPTAKGKGDLVKFDFDHAQ